MIRRFSIFIFVLAVLFFICNIAFAQKGESKAPPKDTATDESSAYTPDDKPKDKLDKSVRVTGPVWVNPLDEDKNKEDVKDFENDENLEDFESEEAEEPVSKDFEE